MALIVFGGGVTNIVGSHSGNTFSKNKGGSYMKKKPHGTNPATTAQVMNRNLISNMSKAFSFTLSDAERAAWRTFAATYPVINKLGNSTFLSAQQIFSKLNCPVVFQGGTMATTPPISTAINTPTSLVVTATSGGAGSVTIASTATGSSGSEMLVVYSSPPLNPGKNFVSSALRQLGSAIAIGSTVDITLQYLTLFGLLPTSGGQRIFCRAYILNVSNGIQSTAIQAATIWS